MSDSHFPFLLTRLIQHSKDGSVTYLALLGHGNTDTRFFHNDNILAYGDHSGSIAVTVRRIPQLSDKPLASPKRLSSPESLFSMQPGFAILQHAQECSAWPSRRWHID